jgi:hypothetical protein
MWSLKTAIPVLRYGNTTTAIALLPAAYMSGSWRIGRSNRLHPIPEPETYAMLLAGLGLLGFIARCHKTA